MNLCVKNTFYFCTGSTGLGSLREKLRQGRVKLSVILAYLFKTPPLQVNFDGIFEIAGDGNVAHPAMIVIAAGNCQHRTSFDHIVTGGIMKSAVGIASDQ